MERSDGENAGGDRKWRPGGREWPDTETHSHGPGTLTVPMAGAGIFSRLLYPVSGVAGRLCDRRGGAVAATVTRFRASRSHCVDVRARQSASERVRARQSASESVSRPSAGRHSALWRPVPAANPNSSIPLNLPFHRRLAPAVGALSNHTSSFKVNHQMTNVNLAPPLHWLSGGNNNNNNISNIFYSNLK